MSAADVMAKMQKAYGTSVVTTGSHTFADTERLPTGIFPLDMAMGGGFPMGKVSIIYGPESCIACDSFIQYEVRSKSGKRRNHKGGTVERLYHRFHHLQMSGRGSYRRKESVDSVFTAPCINDDGRVFHNVIEDVIFSGEKECFKVTTSSGFSIVTTLDHRYFTGVNYEPLSALGVGSTVMIHNKTPFTVEEHAKREKREVVYFKHHPVAPTQMVGLYAYKRMYKSRALVEAYNNGLSYEEYANRLNSGDLQGLVFLPSEFHVHHKDEDVTNDSLDNLEVLTASSHGVLHATERDGNLRYMAVEDIIVSIEPVGVRRTYDLRMASPFNNFVADGFVVHNCNKTNIVLKAIAEGQKRHKGKKKAVFVDVEHGFDPEWATKLGVDVEDLIVKSYSLTIELL